MTNTHDAAPDEIWHRPFTIKGSDASDPVEPPQWVTSVAYRAWQAFEEDGPDQLAPGLPLLGQGLIVRDLPLALSERPPLTVFARKPLFLRAYNRLSGRLGRCAQRYPIYRLTEDGVDPLINRAWLTKKKRSDPDPHVYWASTEDELAGTLDAVDVDKPPVLVLVDDADDIPTPRPPRSHALLTRAPDGEPDTSRLSDPLKLTLPEEGETWKGGGTPSTRRLATTCANVRDPHVNVELVDSSDGELARLKRAWREIWSPDAWDKWTPFLAVSKTLLDRLQADAFVTGEPPEGKCDATSTEGLVSILENMIGAGNSPSGPEPRVFVGLARQVVERRGVRAPEKATWIDNHLHWFEDDPPATLLVDASHTAARAFEHLKDRASPVQTRVDIETVRGSKEPTNSRVVVTAAPGPTLLRDLVCGLSPGVTFLVYPWEVKTYAYARKRFATALSRLGIREWPDLPPPPKYEAVPEPDEPDLVPRPRSPSFKKPSTTGESSEPAEASEDDDIPTVAVATETAAHEFPRDRRLVVLRSGKIHDVDAEKAREGDVLVVPRDGTHPSAHGVITRVCDQNPAMKRTHQLAGMWRKLLRQERREKFAGRSIRDVWRAFRDRGVDISYHQFRFWLREDEPVTPRFENLEALLDALEDVDEGLATMIYNAGTDHKDDRHRVYDHLLDLAEDQLPAIRAGDDGAVVDPQHGVSAEDLHAILTFETITKVTPNDPE